MKEKKKKIKTQNHNIEHNTDQELILDEEPLVSTGVAATLKFLQTKGGPEPELDNWSGRKTDKKPDWVDPAPHIRLEYLDEQGRPMTPKEAFRRLSYKFHGEKPGKNKLEKRMRQAEEEKKRKLMSNIDTPLNTLDKLKQEQEKLQKPFIVLSGGTLTKTNDGLNTPFTTQEMNISKGGGGGPKEGEFSGFKLNSNKKQKI
jgi:U4/U6.U5 tri-snRNP-associated protein 1